MPSTKIKLETLGLARAGNEWDLSLALPEADDLVHIRGDLAELKKLLGKTVDARLVIGAEEEQPVDVEALRKEITSLNAVVEVQKRKLAEAPAMPAGVIGPDHPLAQLARGHLTVIKERATACRTASSKASDIERWRNVELTAIEGLNKLAALVGPEKKNGSQAAAQVQQAVQG